MTTEKLRELQGLVERYLLRGTFAFTSGGTHNFYFDGRMLSLSASGPLLVGNLLWSKIASLFASSIRVDAIGGPVLGAAPLVTATQVMAHIQGKPLPAFYVRESAKGHGAQKLVEGHLPNDGTVVIVEDTVSSGSSVFRAIRAAEESRNAIAQVITLLDWQKGGGERLREEGYDFHPLLLGNLETGEIYTP